MQREMKTNSLTPSRRVKEESQSVLLSAPVWKQKWQMHYVSGPRTGVRQKACILMTSSSHGQTHRKGVLMLFLLLDHYGIAIQL